MIFYSDHKKKNLPRIKHYLHFSFSVSAIGLDKTRINIYRGVRRKIIIVKFNIARSQYFITVQKRFHVNEKAHLLQWTASQL